MNEKCPRCNGEINYDIIIFNTNDPSRPERKVSVKSYNYGQQWQARFSAIING